MESLNLIAYALFLSISFYITIRVGWLCYHHGIHFLIEELQDVVVAHSINKILLTGYYTLNLGYAVLMISSWNLVPDFTTLLSSVCLRVGVLVLGLGCMHYVNIGLVYFLRKRKTSIIHH